MGVGWLLRYTLGGCWRSVAWSVCALRLGSRENISYVLVSVCSGEVPPLSLPSGFRCRVTGRPLARAAQHLAQKRFPKSTFLAHGGLFSIAAMRIAKLKYGTQASGSAPLQKQLKNGPISDPVCTITFQQ